MKFHRFADKKPKYYHTILVLEVTDTEVIRKDTRNAYVGFYDDGDDNPLFGVPPYASKLSAKDIQNFYWSYIEDLDIEEVEYRVSGMEATFKSREEAISFLNRPNIVGGYIIPPEDN